MTACVANDANARERAGFFHRARGNAVKPIQTWAFSCCVRPCGEIESGTWEDDGIDAPRGRGCVDSSPAARRTRKASLVYRRHAIESVRLRRGSLRLSLIAMDPQAMSREPTSEYWVRQGDRLPI